MFDAGSNVGNREVREWVSAEYEAGYTARFAGAPESVAATQCWRAGWADADTELAETTRGSRSVAENREEQFVQQGWNLYEIGGYARLRGALFDETRTDSWKEGWVATDIRLGVSG